MNLEKKSLVQLRGIAQGYGIPDIFSKDQRQLIQAIELKQQDMLPDAPLIVAPREYDARLMTKPPAKRSDEALIREVLAEHVAMGLHLSFDEENWHMRWEKRNDTGTKRMALRTVVECANRIMK